MDRFIDCKVNERKIIFLVLYINDILLALNDLGLPRAIKRFFGAIWYKRNGQYLLCLGHKYWERQILRDIRIVSRSLC
jgi:hypothetical protein